MDPINSCHIYFFVVLTFRSIIINAIIMALFYVKLLSYISVK